MVRYAPGLLVSLTTIALSLALSGAASAGPMCSDGGVFPVPLASFVSCTASGQDSFSAVQDALDLALDPDIVLDVAGSFCPTGSCGGSEFLGSDPGEGFVIDPSTLSGNTGFTFEQIPAGTQFISLKQGNAFEVFKVPGPTPFFLQHMLNGDDTSHISTFAVVPEPSVLALLASVVPVSLVLRRRRLAAGR